MTKRYYNLFRGFAVTPWPEDEPVTAEAQAAVDAFNEHILKNICHGNTELAAWLMGFFAHLVQKPGEKPLVAIVFRGAKGTGKTWPIDCIGHLLGAHYLLTSNRRYLSGNFNGHLENCLFLALDEAFWSGDKQLDGIVKDLITGAHHVIEHKGKEPFKVDNRTRVAIIGNEDWVVPATHDERRFAVFNVGDGRKQDRDFFRQMREGMELGGYRLLLRYLQNYDIRGLDLDGAPKTAALHGQKNASLGLVHNWWLDSLTEGRLLNSDFAEGWVEEVDTIRFRDAFYRGCRERQVGGRLPAVSEIGRELKKCLPDFQGSIRARPANVYRFPSLEVCRAAWEHFIQHKVEWPT